MSGGLIFCDPFSTSNTNKFILVASGYISKWVKDVALTTNDARVVIKFLRNNIFTRFEVPRAIVSDGGKYFYNSKFNYLLIKYGRVHQIATPYLLETSD